jgi:hypothetical protein
MAGDSDEEDASNSATQRNAEVAAMQQQLEVERERAENARVQQVLQEQAEHERRIEAENKKRKLVAARPLSSGSKRNKLSNFFDTGDDEKDSCEQLASKDDGARQVTQLAKAPATTVSAVTEGDAVSKEQATIIRKTAQWVCDNPDKTAALLERSRGNDMMSFLYAPLSAAGKMYTQEKSRIAAERDVQSVFYGSGSGNSNGHDVGITANMARLPPPGSVPAQPLCSASTLSNATAGASVLAPPTAAALSSSSSSASSAAAGISAAPQAQQQQTQRARRSRWGDSGAQPVQPQPQAESLPAASSGSGGHTGITGTSGAPPVHPAISAIISRFPSEPSSGSTDGFQTDTVSSNKGSSNSSLFVASLSEDIKESIKSSAAIGSHDGSMTSMIGGRLGRRKGSKATAEALEAEAIAIAEIAQSFHDTEVRTYAKISHVRFVIPIILHVMGSIMEIYI